MPIRLVERKRAAIFAADIEGYSRLMGRDEVGSLDQLKVYRTIIDGRISSICHRQRCRRLPQARCRPMQRGGPVRHRKRETEPTSRRPRLFQIGIHDGDVV